MSAELDAIISAQRLSDAVYELFTTELGSTMEQAEVASRDPEIMKNFKFSSGGAVLKFQDKAVMRADRGEPVKAYLKAVRRDFLLPTVAADAAKPLDIPEAVLQAARSGNQTKKSELFRLVHGDRPKSAETESLAAVEALIAGKTNEPHDVDLIPDDKTRRAARAADTDHLNNPWRLKEGHPDKAALIEAKIKAIGTKACIGLAKAAGSQINGKPL